MNPEARVDDVVGEARWPMAAAVIVLIGLTFVLPEGLQLAWPWLVPAVEGILLVVLILGDPGEINIRSKRLRVLSVALVSVLVVTTTVWTVRLIGSLIRGDAWTNSAGELLVGAGAVWVGSNIAFGLLYWDLDSGGAANRAHGLPAYPDLAFPQQMKEEIAPPNWRPRFVDYLYLGFTNATAFSPTDTMPLAPWAKIAMTVQSLISLSIIGLVVARAVNVFS
jgi:uncharacterized membrane protein